MNFYTENRKEAKIGDKTMMDTSIDSNAGGNLPNKEIDVADAQLEKFSD